MMRSSIVSFGQYDSVYPSLKVLYKGFKNGKTRVLEQEIVLRGQRVLAFLTLQMFVQVQSS